MRAYTISRQELVVKAIKEIKERRIQCVDDCERIRDAARFDERRADQHARLNAMKMIRFEKNVRGDVFVWVAFYFRFCCDSIIRKLITTWFHINV